MALPRYAAKGAISFLGRYVRRRLLSHSIVFLAVLAAVACSVASQYAVKHLVDVLGTHNPTPHVLWGAVGLLLGLVAGDNLLWRLAGWVSTYAFVAVGGDMRLELFDHLSGQGTRYFVERFPGALAGRITAAANAAWTIENSLTWTTIPPGIAVIGSILVLGTINWKLTAVLIAVVTVLGAIIGWLAAHGKELHQSFAGHAAHVSGDLTDIVSNIGLVRAFGAARREQKRLSGKIDDEMQAQRASLRSLERLRLFHAFTVFAVTAGVLVWSVELWRRGEISTGDVVLTTTLGFTVLHASRDFAMALVDMVQQFAKLGEAVQVLGLPHEMQDAPDAKPLVVGGGSISFRSVNFSYPSGQSVLTNFTLDVPAGQKIGLVGRSGAGKSTIIALLQRLYDPLSGQVLINGQNISEVTQESLRGSIAVVQQDISLFHRSLLENLRYGRPDATDEEVYKAVEAAKCTEFINQLPDGFDTLVGERGMKLSGGQRQRLAIARAFLMNAPVVLLDEATSALDTESEQAIQEALARLFKGRTVIAIAHRLSTLDAFDRIVVLDRGRIVEDGPPRRLLQTRGVYRNVRAAGEGGCGAGALTLPAGRKQLPLIAVAMILAAVSACAGLHRTQQPVAVAPSPPAEAVDAVPTAPPSEENGGESAPGAPAASGITPAGQGCTCVEAKPSRPKPRPRPKPVHREAPPQLPTAPVVSETPPGGVVNAQVREMAVSVMSILGKRVKGPNDEDLGRVVDVLADSTGRVRVAIIDFGGFLGVGNHRIAVDWPLLRFSPDARDPSLLLSLSREKLQTAPEYKENPRPQTLMEPPAAVSEPAASAAAAPSTDSKK